MRIVAMDLGKNKSVVCEYDSESGRHTFKTIRTRPQVVHDLLVEKGPGRVVIETGPVSGWVYDLATTLGVDTQVANTNHPIWRWQMNPKKTDRSDALKLAQLSSMERSILVDHYGLQEGRPHKTLEQLGRSLGISKERVRQIEIKALAKLRSILNPQRAELFS